MKRLLLVTVIMLAMSSVLHGQTQNFSVKKLGDSYSLELVYETFSKLDYCGMINPTTSYTITLDDGAIIEVLCADKISNVPSECVRQTDLNETDVTWSIMGDAILIKATSSKSIKKV